MQDNYFEQAFLPGGDKAGVGIYINCSYAEFRRSNNLLVLIHYYDFIRHQWNVKFGYSEKATKFEKIFHLKFDITE